MDNIIKLRNKIDLLDIDLIKLLNQRMLICQKIGILKKENNIPLIHSNRENEIIDKLFLSQSFQSENNNLSKKEIANLYEIIFNISKSKQK